MMLRLVEHSLTGETYALSLDAEGGEDYTAEAWPVPRSAVLCADGSLWCGWDQESWLRRPLVMTQVDIDRAQGLAAWSDEQPWVVLAEAQP